MANTLGLSEVKQVTTRDVSSGRFHHRYLIDGKSYVQEQDNLDTAGAYEVMPRGTRADRGDGVPVGTDPSLLCGNCFPSE